MLTLRPLLLLAIAVACTAQPLPGSGYARKEQPQRGGLLGLRLGVVSRLVNATINNVQDDRAVPTQYATEVTDAVRNAGMLDSRLTFRG